MILRCRVEGDNWIPIQFEEKLKGGNIKILTVEETQDLFYTPPVVASLLEEPSQEKVVVDLRIDPPYYQILPCPYCGVEEDKDHNPLKHIFRGKNESRNQT